MTELWTREKNQEDFFWKRHCLLQDLCKSSMNICIIIVEIMFKSFVDLNIDVTFCLCFFLNISALKADLCDVQYMEFCIVLG